MALSFTRKVNMSPGQRDTGDVIDAGDVNDLQEALEDISLGTVPIPLAGIAGALGEYTGPWRGPHDCREWGIGADGNDHASDFATMVSELASEENRSVQLVSGDIPVASTVQVAARGITLLGSRGYRPNEAGGTRLLFSGTGACIQIGTDNGNPWDQHDYDGYQDFTIQGVSIKYSGSSTTALTNGLGSYGTGTYGLRDWRGGNVRIVDVMFENLAYGFWGVQSDLNLWTRPQFRYNKVGAYCGPRTDQLVVTQSYSFANDTLYHLDSVRQAAFYGFTTHSDGSSTTPPIKIGTNGWSEATDGIHFNECWFEHTSLYNATIPAFVEVGVGDSSPTTAVTFRNPIILLHDSPFEVSTSRTTALVRADNADRIDIEHPTGSLRQLRALVQNVGTHNPRVRIIDGSNGQCALVEDTSTGRAVVQATPWGGAESVTPSVALTATVGTSETTIPHGLNYTPAILGIVPRGDARIWQSTIPDAANVYLTASSSAAATITLGRGSAQPAFTSVVLSDTFTDSDGTALGSHSPGTGTWAGAVGFSSVTIQSNKAAAGADFQRPMIDTGSTDHRIAVTINLGDDGSLRQAGAIVRSVDASNYWLLTPSRDDVNAINRIELANVVAGVTTIVLRKYLALAANTNYQLVTEVRGDVLRAWVDGFPVMTYEGLNATHPTGARAGFTIYRRGSGTAKATADSLEIRIP